MLGARHPLRDRFFSHVRKTHSCWIWEGNLNDLGYGRVKVCGRLRAAHRVAYELEVGPVPHRASLRHRCGNAACVRPSHLSVSPIRLRPEDIEAIRRSTLSSTTLGEMYGVSCGWIRQIKLAVSAR